MKEVSEAIKLIMCFDSIIGGAEAEAIARRLDDLPALVVTTGLVPTLTFYLSKVRDKEYKQLKTLKTLLPMLVDNRCERLEGRNEVFESLSGEGGGYGAALALVTAAMVRLGIIEGRVNVERPERFIAKELVELMSDPAKLRDAEARILPVLVEFKKLSNAFYKKEKGG